MVLTSNVVPYLLCGQEAASVCQLAYVRQQNEQTFFRVCPCIFYSNTAEIFLQIPSVQYVFAQLLLIRPQWPAI